MIWAFLAADCCDGIAGSTVGSTGALHSLQGRCKALSLQGRPNIACPDNGKKFSGAMSAKVAGAVRHPLMAAPGVCLVRGVVHDPNMPIVTE